eukprot:4411448-Amphidinium_carterae.1
MNVGLAVGCQYRPPPLQKSAQELRSACPASYTHRLSWVDLWCRMTGCDENEVGCKSHCVHIRQVELGGGKKKKNLIAPLQVTDDVTPCDGMEGAN